MDYKTKPHKRTIITFGIIALIGFIGIIASLFISTLIVKVISIITCLILLGASIFKILIELKYSIEICEDDNGVNLFIVKSLFSSKQVDVSQIVKINKSITEYTFYLEGDIKYCTSDVDLVNINNIISFFEEKGVKVRVIG